MISNGGAKSPGAEQPRLIGRGDIRGSLEIQTSPPMTYCVHARANRSSSKLFETHRTGTDVPKRKHVSTARLLFCSSYNFTLSILTLSRKASEVVQHSLYRGEIKLSPCRRYLVISTDNSFALAEAESPTNSIKPRIQPRSGCDTTGFRCLRQRSASCSIRIRKSHMWLSMYYISLSLEFSLPQNSHSIPDYLQDVSSQYSA
jgi:hypothetical protein